VLTQGVMLIKPTLLGFKGTCGHIGVRGHTSCAQLPPHDDVGSQAGTKSSFPLHVLIMSTSVLCGTRRRPPCSIHLLGNGASKNGLRASRVELAESALLGCVPLRVEDAAERGKILRVMESCEVGEVILVEAPAMTVTQKSAEPTLQDLQIWLDRFAGLPSETRQSIVALSQPSAAAPEGTLSALLGPNGEHAAKLLRCPVHVTADEMWLFFRILECNTFQVPLVGGGVRIELLLITSRINHSCLPNALRGPGTEEGTVEVRALRPLKAGDEVNISYLSDESLCKSTVPRRAALQGRWQFKCGCERCIAPDTLRAFRCALPGCKGVHSTGGECEDVLGPCSCCGGHLDDETRSCALRAERRFGDALPGAQDLVEDAVGGLSRALDTQDGMALQQAVGSGFAALAACRDVARSCPQVSSAHHLAVRLSKMAASVRTRLGDAFAAAGQREQATELWGQSAVELQQALNSEQSALRWPRDGRAAELIKLSGLYKRLNMTRDSRNCLVDALSVMNAIYWACAPTCRQEAAQMQRDVEAVLAEAVAES